MPTKKKSPIFTSTQVAIANEDAFEFRCNANVGDFPHVDETSDGGWAASLPPPVPPAPSSASIAGGSSMAMELIEAVRVE